MIVFGFKYGSRACLGARCLLQPGQVIFFPSVALAAGRTAQPYLCNRVPLL